MKPLFCCSLISAFCAGVISWYRLAFVQAIQNVHNQCGINSASRLSVGRLSLFVWGVGSWLLATPAASLYDLLSGRPFWSDLSLHPSSSLGPQIHLFPFLHPPSHTSISVHPIMHHTSGIRRFVGVTLRIHVRVPQCPTTVPVHLHRAPCCIYWYIQVNSLAPLLLQEAAHSPCIHRRPACMDLTAGK